MYTFITYSWFKALVSGIYSQFKTKQGSACDTRFGQQELKIFVSQEQSMAKRHWWCNLTAPQISSYTACVTGITECSPA